MSLGPPTESPKHKLFPGAVPPHQGASGPCHVLCRFWGLRASSHQGPAHPGPTAHRVGPAQGRPSWVDCTRQGTAGEASSEVTRGTGFQPTLDSLGLEPLTLRGPAFHHPRGPSSPHSSGLPAAPHPAEPQKQQSIDYLFPSLSWVPPLGMAPRGCHPRENTRPQQPSTGLPVARLLPLPRPKGPQSCLRRKPHPPHVHSHSRRTGSPELQTAHREARERTS